MSAPGGRCGLVLSGRPRHGDTMSPSAIAEGEPGQTGAGDPIERSHGRGRCGAPRGKRRATRACAAAGRQPELHDGAGVSGYDPAFVARPEGDGRVVSSDHVVLAAVRAAAGHRRVCLDVCRSVHGGRAAGTGRPGGLAGDSLCHHGGAAVSADGSRRAALDRAGRTLGGLASSGSHLSAMSLFRGAADDGHGRGERVLFRTRANVDGAGDRSDRNRS